MNTNAWHPKRISFDVDDTLVCCGIDMPAERTCLPAFLHRQFCEPLRQGTCAMMHELRRRGWSIWIYTSSLRPLFYIRMWLYFHGIRIGGVINAERHQDALSSLRLSRVPSKYPPAFGIDLHVDDSEGVRMEGDEHGFRVL